MWLMTWQKGGSDFVGGYTVQYMTITYCFNESFRYSDPNIKTELQNGY